MICVLILRVTIHPNSLSFFKLFLRAARSIESAVAVLRRYDVRSPGVRPPPPPGSETPCPPAPGGHSPSLPRPCPVRVDLCVLDTSQEWTLERGPLGLHSRRRRGSLGAAASCRATVLGGAWPGVCFRSLFLRGVRTRSKLGGLWPRGLTQPTGIEARRRCRVAVSLEIICGSRQTV